MTLKQQAHTLIDAMGEDELRAWILLIGKRETAVESNVDIDREKALSRLMEELKKGDLCEESFSEEDACAMLGV